MERRVLVKERRKERRSGVEWDAIEDRGRGQRKEIKGSSLFLEIGSGDETTTALGQLDLPPFVALSFVDDEDESTSLHPQLLWVLGHKVVHRYRLAHLRHCFPHDPQNH